MTTATGYDIGIGRCADIAEALVAVRLDSAMMRRFAPTDPWRTSGSCMLWLTLDQCSARRPPVVGGEVYLDSATLDSVGRAALDVGNTGTRVDVDLGMLIRDTQPVIEPPQPVAANVPDPVRPKPWLAIAPASPRKRGRPRA